MQLFPALLSLVAVLVLFLPSCSKESDEQQDESLLALSITDATGKDLNLKKIPERIVSLAPTITDTIFMLGGGDMLVGVTNHCIVPPSEKEIERVGQLLNPSVEKVITLEPHLVIATMEGNTPQLVERLRQTGLSVFVVGEKRCLKDIKFQTFTIGKLLGKEDKANEIWLDCVARLEKTRALVRTLPEARVFLQLNHKPLMTAGGDTFLDEMISYAGAVNIAHGLERYPIYSLEELVAQDPDVILVVSMGDITDEALAMWKSFPGLKAVRNGRIYVLDADKFCSPSLAEFPDCVDELVEILH